MNQWQSFVLGRRWVVHRQLESNGYLVIPQREIKLNFAESSSHWTLVTCMLLFQISNLAAPATTDTTIKEKQRIANIMVASLSFKKVLASFFSVI
jgi:hypothetical protein